MAIRCSHIVFRGSSEEEHPSVKRGCRWFESSPRSQRLLKGDLPYAVRFLDSSPFGVAVQSGVDIRLSTRRSGVRIPSAPPARHGSFGSTPEQASRFLRQLSGSPSKAGAPVWNREVAGSIPAALTTRNACEDYITSSTLVAPACGRAPWRERLRAPRPRFFPRRTASHLPRRFRKRNARLVGGRRPVRFRFGAPGQMPWGLHRLRTARSRVRIPSSIPSVVEVAQLVERVRSSPQLLVARSLTPPVV